MKYITIFPEYPISIHQMEELKRYRKKIINAQIDTASLIRVLNGPSRILRTVDGHHVNKSFIVGARDYVDPTARKSQLADYERRNQINLYVSMELSTVEEVAGIISVRKITDNVELCLERAMAPTETGEFIGMLTDWSTTNKLDSFIDPGIMNVFDNANLSHSFLAVNRNLIKSFVLVREMGEENVERVIQAKA
ncbi:MAG: hypothetical protein P1S46_08560 [bacterium]|nr:hypothetical protein [bacterium]MDT8394846.1 hypothetical protein [bacterium]